MNGRAAAKDMVELFSDRVEKVVCDEEIMGAALRVCEMFPPKSTAEMCAETLVVLATEVRECVGRAEIAENADGAIVVALTHVAMAACLLLRSLYGQDEEGRRRVAADVEALKARVAEIHDRLN